MQYQIIGQTVPAVEVMLVRGESMYTQRGGMIWQTEGISMKTNARGGLAKSLARMFTDMKYSVLYEGIEDEKDEERCREMSATYLQGYKYSRPVPIEKLREFIPKAR